MLTKEDKNQKTQSINKQKNNTLTQISKILDKFSFKHLDKIIDKEDAPFIVFLVVIVIIFSPILSKSINEEGTFFGFPYWFVIFIIIVIVLLVGLLIIKRRKTNKSQPTIIS